MICGTQNFGHLSFFELLLYYYTKGAHSSWCLTFVCVLSHQMYWLILFKCGYSLEVSRGNVAIRQAISCLVKIVEPAIPDPSDQCRHQKILYVCTAQHRRAKRTTASTYLLMISSISSCSNLFILTKIDAKYLNRDVIASICVCMLTQSE